MTTKRSLKIFVSSTCQDLQPERASVCDAIQRLSEKAVAMEYFGSRPDTPLNESIKEVEQSHIYIGIFGFRYGEIPRKKGKSFTELEYRRARSKKIPCLIYFKHEQTPITRDQIEPDEAKRVLLETLKRELKERHSPAYFRTPEQLAMQVTADLVRHLRDLRGEQTPPAKRTLLHTLADFPNEVEGDWVVLCGGKREEIPVSKERDIFAVNADPREIMWIFRLALPTSTLIVDDKYPDYLQYLLKDEKRNLIAVGSPAVNLVVRECFGDAFFRYYYENVDLQKYRSLEEAEAGKLRTRLSGRCARHFDAYLLKRRETFDKIKTFWKPIGYALPLERYPNQPAAAVHYGLISLCLHPYHRTRMAVMVGGGRFVSTVAAVRMLGDHEGLRRRPLGGVVRIEALDERRGFDVYKALYRWETKPYTLQAMIDAYEKMVISHRCEPFGYSEEDALGFAKCLADLQHVEGHKRKDARGP